MTRPKKPKKKPTQLDLVTCKQVKGGATDDLWKFRCEDDWESPVV